MSPSVRIAPLIGLAVGLWAFVGLAVPQAAAAESPTMTTEVLSGLTDLVSSASRVGVACLESLDGIGIALGLDPHVGGASACPQLQGIGLTFLGLLAIIAIAVGRMRLTTEQRRLDVVRRLVEQGLQPPAELLDGPAGRDRRKGIVLLFAGAGLVAAGVVLADRGIAAGGLVPAFIGIGYLVSYRLARGPDS